MEIETKTEVEAATFDETNYFLVGGIESDNVMNVVKWIYQANYQKMMKSRIITQVSNLRRIATPL